MKEIESFCALGETGAAAASRALMAALSITLSERRPKNLFRGLYCNNNSIN